MISDIRFEVLGMLILQAIASVIEGSQHVMTGGGRAEGEARGRCRHRRLRWRTLPPDVGWRQNGARA